MAYVDVVSISENTIYVRLSGCDTTYPANDRTIYWYVNGVFKGPMPLGAYAANSATYIIIGLTPGTRYEILAVVGNGVWTAEFSATVYTDEPAVVRPSNWSWTSSISANLSIGITATEWNNFCSRINEFRAYKGMGTYSFTRVYSGTEISTDIVNQAHSAINGISGRGTLPSQASRGATITAYFFTQLRNALNAVP